VGPVPPYQILRGPEVGLVMVRARAGGSGARFNLGELTVTRCTVRLEDGTVGHAYLGGRRPGAAERAAVLDALLQDGERRPHLERVAIEPLAARHLERARAAAARAGATRVEFLTMVRGEE
jgi:alpha-D-ribose 1-methylphosphonate 5-triphosphate synthase subunit PhnG